MNLKNFFNPKTIAVIGASNNPKKVGNVLMKKLSSFKGKIVPVNIKHKKILGKESYPSVTKYTEKIDLAIIAIPAKIVKKILEDCGNKRIKNVIIISAGFSETGNKKLEQEIIKVAKKYKINLLGPNCFGITNPYSNLDTTFANTSAKKGNIAFISQSGALWSYLSDISASNKIGLGFSGFVSLGNMADLNFSDFIDYFNRDKKTKKIILYIEKLKQGKRFINICKKSKKEIIVVKAGKTEKGSRAAISHTGSLATDFEVYKGAFKQAHVKLLDSLSSAFNFKKSKIKIPIKTKGNKVVIITNAGGGGALMTDYLIKKGFDVKPPIDLIGTASAKDYKTALSKLKNKNHNSIIVILTPQRMSEPEKTAQVIVDFKKQNKKYISAFFLGEKSINKARSILKKNKIPCFTRI
ncbi:Peptidyl-lysine N-acetyltransferase Pat [subsurface metagenome]